MSMEGLQVETMAITTLEDAVQAVERGLASCYGLDGGRPWVGFGECARGGQQSERSCEVFLQIPASDNAVRACQRVQQSYDGPRVHGVEGFGLGSWCGRSWADIDNVSTDRERVSCPGCRTAATELASDATVEAEIRRACAAYPEIGEVSIGYQMYEGARWFTVNGMLMSPSVDGPFDRLRRSTENIAKHMAENLIPQPCGVCRGYRTLLCHACKGGVGT